MRNDIILDDNYDLLLVNGDFYIDNSDIQNIKQIMLSAPGSWKRTPTLGVYIEGDLKGYLGPMVKNRIKEHLKSDGYENTLISFNENGEISIKL